MVRSLSVTSRNVSPPKHRELAVFRLLGLPTKSVPPDLRFSLLTVVGRDAMQSATCSCLESAGSRTRRSVDIALQVFTFPHPEDNSHHNSFHSESDDLLLRVRTIKPMEMKLMS
jgi:hypothetical protein